MIAVRRKDPADQAWTEEALSRWWCGTRILAHGEEFDAAQLPTLVAGDRHGLLTYRVAPPVAEIVTLNAVRPRHGVGTALVEALAGELAAAGIREIRVTMTNDNLDALRFYQRRGFRIAAVSQGAVDAARRVKPTIPVVGNFGIPRHDELELVRVLADPP